jgi:hypothetical protein
MADKLRVEVYRVGGLNPEHTEPCAGFDEALAYVRKRKAETPDLILRVIGRHDAATVEQQRELVANGAEWTFRAN